MLNSLLKFSRKISKYHFQEEGGIKCQLRTAKGDKSDQNWTVVVRGRVGGSEFSTFLLTSLMNGLYFTKHLERKKIESFDWLHTMVRFNV